MLVNSSHEESPAFIDLSESTRTSIENLLILGLMLPTCFIGIPSNFINCLVFIRQGLQNRMNFCLFSLAVTECLHLVCTFTIFVISAFVRLYNKTLGEECYLRTAAYLTGVLYAIRLTSDFISVVIATERCVCVVFPLRASSLIRTRTMCILMISMFLLFQCFHITYPLSFTASTYKTNTSEFRHLDFTDFFNDNVIVINIIHIVVLDITVPVALFLILFSITIITVLKLKIAMNWRKRSAAMMGNDDGHQTSLTTMLLVMSIVHLVTKAPFIAWKIVIFVIPGYFTQRYNIFMILKTVANVFPPMNSAIHIFIYYFRSPRFRSVLSSLFCRIRNQ